MALYDELIRMVITESSIEDYKNRVLREGRFLERIKDKFTKKKNKKEEIKNKEPITDAKYNLQQVTSKDQFKKLYLGEALTKEGINILESEEFPQKIANKLVNEYNAKQPINMYWFLGKDVNKLFDLKGNNAYNNNFHFFAIDLMNIPFEDIPDLKGVLGFRYFNDIVDNNEYTEFAAGRHPYSDQIEWLWDAYDRQGKTQRPKTNNKAINNKYGLGLKYTDIFDHYKSN